ncbi:MAG: permease, partial [Desulfobacterales bacterium]
IMTVARPFAAFVTATFAGIAENLFGNSGKNKSVIPDLSCPVDNCCDGKNCDPDTHRGHHALLEKIKAGVGYAYGDLWEDIAKWFLFGVLLAGFITVLIPDDIFSRYLGSGLSAMLLMLAVGIPLYICATASTPIAAALILKGVSPGAALVFLLVGPATNVASLTVLTGILGRRATAIYLGTIAVAAVFFGLVVDHVYNIMGFSAQAMVGQASEVVPSWAQWAGALLVLFLSIKPLYRMIRSLAARLKPATPSAPKTSIPAPSDPESLLTPTQCGPT